MSVLGNVKDMTKNSTKVATSVIATEVCHD